MDSNDLCYLSATELSGLLRQRQVSPVEATSAYLERIDRLNPSLNAYLTVCGEEALATARGLEAEVARGGYRGPLHGIPVAVKDQMHARGVRTTGGSTITDNFVPQEDSTVVARLKDAGAVLLGKLNMTELATTAFYHAFAPARNPWDLERHTGGSSSGSGAATAGFLCATSLGEDTGGSVRFPAAWCGLAGMRPTWGRVSRYGVMPGLWSMDAIGPISRSVSDCAMTFQAIAGHDPLDPYTWETPVPDYAASLGGDIRGVRVGIVREITDADGVDVEVRNAVSKAAEVLAELGAQVEDVSVPLATHALTISSALRIDAPMRYREVVRRRLSELGEDNRLRYLVGSVLPGMAYNKAQKLRSMLRRQVLAALESVDVLLSPTTKMAAQQLEPRTQPGDDQRSRRLDTLLTFAYSLANTPAISVCCGFTSGDLPIGLQLAGRPFDEELLFKVAHAYEQNTPWHRRRPAAIC